MAAPVDPLAQHACVTRLGLLRFLRSPAAAHKVAQIQACGLPYTMPAAWGALPLAEQARRVVAAEARRVSEARLWAFDQAAAEAVLRVATDPTAVLPVTADLVPSTHGMIVAATPIAYTDEGYPVTAVTWGPPADGFGQGVHVTWWSDLRLATAADGLEADEYTPAERERYLAVNGPLTVEVDMHLPFAPLIDARLMRTVDLDEHDRVFVSGIRAAACLWHALAAGDVVATSEERCDPATNRELAALKAHHRSATVARAPRADSADALAAHGRTLLATLLGDHAAPLYGPAAVPEARDITWDRARDHELPSDLRWLPVLARTADDAVRRLEQEAEQRYPGVFGLIEELRAREFGAWPSGCWMPLMRVVEVLGKHYRSTVVAVGMDTAVQHALVVAGLGAWRAAGRHSVLLEALPDPLPTPPPIHELPQWAPITAVHTVYVDHSDDGTPVYGGAQLGFLDHRAGPTGDETTDLLLFDIYADKPGLEAVGERQLVLAGATLDDAARATAAVSLHGDATGRRWTDDEIAATTADSFRHHLALLAVLKDPDRHGRTVTEAAAAVGLRPISSWPPPPGPNPHATVWRIAC